MAEPSCSAAQRRVMEILSSFGGQQGLRNSMAFKTAVLALEKAGCSVGLRGDVDRLELELRMPAGMAGMLRQEIPRRMTCRSSMEERTSFEVFRGLGGESVVRIRGVDTSDYRSDPSDPENAPKVLKVVLESLGMTLAAREVEELLWAPEKVQSRAEAEPHFAGAVRSEEDVTGVFRNGVRVGPGASGICRDADAQEQPVDSVSQKLGSPWIAFKIK